MKSEIEWSQHVLEGMMANGAEESVHLDFKASGALDMDKKKDICKDVSAFANSDGGILIYGMNEIDHKAASLSFIDGDKMTKEWLEQVIKDGIQRRIDGVRIHPVRIDSDTKKTVYVVDVPVSPLAPHMTKDNKYYKRFNFMSVPMEEYEVRQTFERRHKVLLDFADVSIELTNRDDWFDDNHFEFKLTFHISNIGRSAAKDYKLRIAVKGADGCKYSYSANSEYNLVKPGKEYNLVLSTTNSFSIFPEEVINAMEFILIIPFAETHNIVDNLEIKQTLFTEAERLDDTFKPGTLMNDLINECVGAESKEDGAIQG